MNETMHNRFLEWGRPRSFSGLMILYESSYQRLLQLVPEMDLPFDRAISRSDRDADLHLRVLARCKYTTDIHLTYWFPAGADGGDEPDPDLVVRVYRDAELAEALCCGRNLKALAARGLNEGSQHYVRRRWGRNLLLNKWLEYCLGHGHGFVLAGRPRVGVGDDGLPVC